MRRMIMATLEKKITDKIGTMDEDLNVTKLSDPPRKKKGNKEKKMKVEIKQDVNKSSSPQKTKRKYEDMNGADNLVEIGNSEPKKNKTTSEQNNHSDSTTNVSQETACNNISNKKKKKKAITNGNDATEEANSTSNNKKESNRSIKRQKKLKSEEKLADKSKADRKEALLLYLNTFTHNRSVWKFNKKMQTDLIQMCLEPEVFPDAEFSNLIKYYEGMKGNSTKFAQKIAETAIKKHESWLEKKKETGQTDLEICEETGEQPITETVITRAKQILDIFKDN